MIGLLQVYDNTKYEMNAFNSITIMVGYSKVFDQTFALSKLWSWYCAIVMQFQPYTYTFMGCFKEYIIVHVALGWATTYWYM